MQLCFNSRTVMCSNWAFCHNLLWKKEKIRRDLKLPGLPQRPKTFSYEDFLRDSNHWTPSEKPINPFLMLGKFSPVNRKAFWKIKEFGETEWKVLQPHVHIFCFSPSTPTTKSFKTLFKSTSTVLKKSNSKCFKLALRGSRGTGYNVQNPDENSLV